MKEYNCTATLYTTVSANSPEEAENIAHERFYERVRNGNFTIEKTEIKDEQVEVPEE